MTERLKSENMLARYRSRRVPADLCCTVTFRTRRMEGSLASSGVELIGSMTMVLLTLMLLQQLLEVVRKFLGDLEAVLQVVVETDDFRAVLFENLGSLLGGLAMR